MARKTKAELVLEDLAKANKLSVAELRAYQTKQGYSLPKMKEIFSAPVEEIVDAKGDVHLRPRVEQKSSPLPKRKKYDPMPALEFTPATSDAIPGKKLSERQQANIDLAAMEGKTLKQADQDNRTEHTAGKTADKDLLANARPYGGYEKAIARNSWLNKIEQTGFANYTGPMDPGSTSKALPISVQMDNKVFAMLLEEKFGYNPDGLAKTDRYFSWLGNLKKYLGRMPTASEAFAAAKAGDGWRDVLPRKSTIGPTAEGTTMERHSPEKIVWKDTAKGRQWKKSDAPEIDPKHLEIAPLLAEKRAKELAEKLKANPLKNTVSLPSPAEQGPKGHIIGSKTAPTGPIPELTKGWESRSTTIASKIEKEAAEALAAQKARLAKLSPGVMEEIAAKLRAAAARLKK